MKLKNNMMKFFVALTVFSFSSCETFDLDQTENPSTLNQSFLDPVFTFNYVQLQLPDFVNSNNSFTQRVTRQMAMTGGNTYENAFSPELFDTNWRTGYLILNAIKQMEPKATAAQQNYILGASKVIRCYVLMSLTDTYGNIPYSEALGGNDNLTPAFDESKNVYAGVYGELNDAIALLQSDAAANDVSARDLYYGDEDGNGDRSKWVTLAKTLKLKMLNNARRVGIPGYVTATEVASLMTENDLIDNLDEDFEFKYGTERDIPNSRHPDYNNDYEFGGGPYIGNYYMWAVSREKREPQAGPYPYFDPRTQYYFYRQTANTDGDSQTLPCENIARPEHYDNSRYFSFYLPPSSSTPVEAAYCTTDLNADATAFWGRDHGDMSGIPQDDELRTVHGLYPAGGAIAPNGTTLPVANTEGEEGALGEGIMPIMLSSFVSFIKAELIVTNVVSGDANAELLKGIDQSIYKVTNFLPGQSGAPSSAVNDAKTIAYKNFINTAFNAESDVERQLEIIVKEYYVAAWGNGLETYNNYRRTGYPSNMQPTFEVNSGAYYYSALYPAISVNNNPNAPSNNRTRRVFWDANLTLQ